MPSTGGIWHELAGGTVGGVLGMTFVYPLDTVKCRLQTAPPSQYGGTTHTIVQMIRNEGALSIYRGLLSPVVGYGALFASSFAAYGQAGRYLLQRRGGLKGDELTLGEASLAGMYAGLVQAPLRQIFERVKGVMQVRQGEKGKAPFRWSGACAVELVRTEGLIMGLFRGVNSTMLREAVQFALYYPTYEVCKRELVWAGSRFGVSTSGPSGGSSSSSSNNTGRGVNTHPLILMAAGGIAGTVTWLPPVYMLDVVKTRMQTAPVGLYQSTWDCAVKTYRSEGLPAFFRGLGPSLLRAFPLHAVIFLGYELTTAHLRDREASQSENHHQHHHHHHPRQSQLAAAAPSAARAAAAAAAAAANATANAAAEVGGRARAAASVVETS